MDELGQPGRISTLISYFIFLYFSSNIIITIKIIIRYARIIPLLSLFYRNTIRFLANHGFEEKRDGDISNVDV